tara:strand:+ start:283 stop:708 length:426 start_codon:yes stop_codon:yes gene_type:complete
MKGLNEIKRDNNLAVIRAARDALSDGQPSRSHSIVRANPNLFPEERAAAHPPAERGSGSSRGDAVSRPPATSMPDLLSEQELRSSLQDAEERADAAFGRMVSLGASVRLEAEREALAKDEYRVLSRLVNLYRQMLHVEDFS